MEAGEKFFPEFNEGGGVQARVTLRKKQHRNVLKARTGRMGLSISYFGDEDWCSKDLSQTNTESTSCGGEGDVEKGAQKR